MRLLGPLALWSIGVLLATLAYGVETSELRAALKLKPNVDHGQRLYENCTGCHQPDGAGAADGSVPNIAGQHRQVILKQLTDFRDTERIDIRMEAAASSHRLKNPQDLADVAAYIASLPTQPAQDLGPNKFTAVGNAAYARSCRSCHGPAGEGNGEQWYPRLAGQHYSYLVKQIDAMIGGSRFNISWDHAQLIEGLTDDELVGLADYLARQKTAGRPAQQ